MKYIIAIKPTYILLLFFTEVSGLCSVTVGDRELSQHEEATMYICIVGRLEEADLNV